MITNKGEKNYLDVSLSPNEKMLVYTVVGIGGFVTDINGEILHELGDVNTPKWINNKELLFYETKDDGHYVLSSEIFVKNIETKQKFHISKPIGEILEFPTALENGKSIIAQTPSGKMYLFNTN